MGNLKFFKNFKDEIKRSISKVKVIYTDLDGTMLNDKGCLIKDDKDNYYFDVLMQLKNLSAKNIDLVLVSGRNKMQLRYNAQILDLRNYISELGSEVVYDLGKEIHLTYDKSRQKYDFASLGPDLEAVVSLLKKEFPSKIDYSPDWNRYRSTNVLFLGEIDLNKANKLLEENGYGDSVIINNGLTGMYSTNLNVSKVYFYNLMPKGINKAAGVRLDKKIRHLERENCIALGDSLEDLKIAGEVGYFFLINNNIHEEKDVLDVLPEYENVYISDHKMNRGWVEVISYLFI
ncbi:HAD hydrolase family protein [bacterium]|nr:HAD hydrolase family protein [bacterium]